MLSKTENDHDPEITCLAHEEGAEGAKDEYEKDLQYNSQFYTNLCHLDSESSEYKPQTEH